MGVPYPYGDDDPKGGRYILLEYDSVGKREFLVYAANTANLAHEIAHVLLIAFRTIGHDPRNGDGEPFCYMLSQLVSEGSY